MTTAAQTHYFEAEVKEVLDLVIHSLYSHKDVFLRELISNASDALDRLRHAALTNGDLMGDAGELGIFLDPDESQGVLRICDNGIGMTRDELVQNLGTIASSGTRKFLDAMKEHGSDDLPELIGRFGVGFYSVFMVADKVVVETRSVEEETGWRWVSSGGGEYTLEEVADLPRGTVVALHLKEAEVGTEDSADKKVDDDMDDPRRFLQPWVLRDLVRRWSDFVEYPIQLEVEKPAPPPEEGEEPGEPELVLDTLNSQQPLWTRSKDEITSAEYEQFYEHLAGWGKPLETLHLKTEGTLEYSALVFIPEQAPFDLSDPARAKARISLYVRRVRIQEECEELLPSWLRFVVGVVESSDLPLNVSREAIQTDGRVRQIQRHLVRKLLDTLANLLQEDRKRYEQFWEAFGVVLKEGIWGGDDDNNRISKLCLFHTSKDEGWRTLAEVKADLGDDADSIGVLVAPDRKTALASAHLEAQTAADREVVLLTDPVDEWMLQRLTTFEETPLKAIDRGDAGLDDEDTRKEREARDEDKKDFLAALRSAIGDQVSKVRFSSRLKDSPAVLVGDEGAYSGHMERMLRRAGHELPPSQRVLEINPDHVLVRALEKLHLADAASPRVHDAGELLLGQALIREGGVPTDPARFSELLTGLMGEVLS
jgi:molecular chaperone HtpG